MPENCLCIGGSFDAKIIAFRGEYINVPIYEPPMMPFVDEDPLTPVRVTFDSYRVENLRVGARLFPIYIERSLSMEDAIERLLSGYRSFW